MPNNGFLHIEGRLPFLIVYRAPRHEDPGTAKLIVNEAAYVSARSGTFGLKNLVTAIAAEQCEAFGAFLVVEVWAAKRNDWREGQPGIRLYFPHSYTGRFDHSLRQAFSRLRSPQYGRVEIKRTNRSPRAGSISLLSEVGKCLSIGIEVTPWWRDSQTGRVYPKELREFVREFSNALRFALHQFSCHHTQHCPIDYKVLGRSALAKIVWQVDRELAEVADRFDFLLQVTPINAHEAWVEFQRGGCRSAPVLHYRPLTDDPIVLKRRLFSIRVERVNDPAVAELFRERVIELDRQISLMGEIESSQFLLGSQQLFGEVSLGTLRLAQRILAELPPRSRDDGGQGNHDAQEFAERARAEVAFYHDQDSDVNARVEVRADVSSGLMVSNGNLLIGHETQIPTRRVEALLQHEIGTHMVTFHNGRAQPLRQLYSGLAGYDVLQEGLAVFAEYLAGGLSRPRLRLLAARVVGAKMMVDGADFADTYDLLHTTHGFSRRIAFNITLRLYRGGGLTKDSLYLDGLQQVFDFVRDGGDLATLFVGKFATAHIPLIRDLALRGVLVPPRLLPRFLALPGSGERLARARSGIGGQGLLEILSQAD